MTSESLWEAWQALRKVQKEYGGFFDYEPDGRDFSYDKIVEAVKWSREHLWPALERQPGQQRG